MGPRALPHVPNGLLALGLRLLMFEQAKNGSGVRRLSARPCGNWHSQFSTTSRSFIPQRLHELVHGTYWLPWA